MNATLLSQPVVWATSVVELLAIIALIPTAIALFGYLICHRTGCFRLGRFQHGHFRLCRVHHPKVPSKGSITDEHIRRITREQIRRVS